MAKKLVRLTEGDLHRIIKESVNKILKENDMPNRMPINELKNSTIKNAYDKTSFGLSKMSHRKLKQAFNFEDNLRDRIIQLLANDSEYWTYDFDEYEYELPKNWNEMSMEEKAEWVYFNGSWTLDDWLDFYRYEFED